MDATQPVNPPTEPASVNDNTKKKRRPATPELPDSHSPTASSSSACLSATSFAGSKQRGFRVFNGRRNPRALTAAARHRAGDVDAVALHLGMSIAAVFAQICTLAVRESLANAFGDQFESFVRNFEKSFRSTLMTLRLVNESSMKNGLEHQKPANRGTSISEVNLHFKDGLEDPACESSIKNGVEHQKPTIGGSSILEVDMQSPCILEDSGRYPDLSEFNLEPALQSITSNHQISNLDELNENMLVESMNQLTLHDRETIKQLACVSSNTSCSAITNTKRNTFEKAVVEQARSNDLKTFEIGLMIKKLQLKERQLAVNSQSNILERWKLSLGVSRASFKAEKFKNQLEDAKHTELLKTCIDCLVAGLFIMVGCLGYGTYVYSHQRITEATAACTPSTESKSWWMPKSMLSVNSGLQTLKCQVQVLSRMLFGVLMILAVAYLLFQRSATSHHAMPVTFILLLLGALCGLAGKLCVDTLGGSGYHWLLYWEVLCLLHFFSNFFISTLCIILVGPVTAPEKTGTCQIIVPYWMRRVVFYSTMLLFLPLLCGLIPFAGPREWKDHFSSLAVEYFWGTDYY
nr:protein CPR-5 [Ipomoea batatas]